MRWTSTRISLRRSSRKWTQFRYSGHSLVTLTVRTDARVIIVLLRRCVRQHFCIDISTQDRQALDWRVTAIIVSRNSEIVVAGVESRAGTSQRRAPNQTGRGATNRGRSGSADAGVLLVQVDARLKRYDTQTYFCNVFRSSQRNKSVP